MVAAGFAVYGASLGGGAGYAAAAVFGLAAIGFGIVLAQHRPALVIDDTGVATPRRRVPWAEVTGTEVTKNRMLPAPLLLIRTTTGRPLRILLRDLDTPTDDIQAELNRHLPHP